MRPATPLRRRTLARRHRAPVLATVALALAAPGLAAQQLAPTEQAIAAYADGHAEEAIALLERVVNINSGTMNFDGVREVGAVFREELDALGLTTTWIDLEASAQRAGHLFAEHQGGAGRTVLLIGHLDTVFEKDSPFQRFERDGMRATGPGTEDMKGGDVVVIYALKALQAAGALEHLNVIVAFTGDEEETGDPLAVSRAPLIEAARRSDFALGFEGGVGGIGSATVARRGFTGWTLTVAGTPAHSSQIFREDLGSGAIFEAARILDAFHRELGGEQYLTFNPGAIVGGTTIAFDPMQSRGTAFGKTNVIAESTVVVGDLRFISDGQREEAKGRMREIVARHHPGTTAEIVFDDSYPAMAPTDANYELLATLDKVSRDLGTGGIEPVDPGRRGAADVSFVATEVLASLDGLGIFGDGGHTVNEWVSLASLPIMIKRAAILIWRIGQPATPE